MLQRLIFGLLFLASLVTPLSAHADTFLYSIDWHPVYYIPAQFVGSDSFTVDHLLVGDVYIYGPNFTPHFWPGYTYIYAPDFTTPVGSTVAALRIVNELVLTSPFTNEPWWHYGVGGDIANNVSAVIAGVVPDPLDPYSFYSEAVSLHITRLSDTAPVPEPSTLLLLGTGGLGIAARLRRRT